MQRCKRIYLRWQRYVATAQAKSIAVVIPFAKQAGDQTSCLHSSILLLPLSLCPFAYVCGTRHCTTKRSNTLQLQLPQQIRFKAHVKQTSA